MTDSPEQIFAAAAKLPHDLRAELVARLTDTLDDDQASVESIEQAWREEAKRRRAELEAGEVELIDAELVDAELLELVRSARAHRHTLP